MALPSGVSGLSMAHDAEKRSDWLFKLQWSLYVPPRCAHTVYLCVLCGS